MAASQNQPQTQPVAPSPTATAPVPASIPSVPTPAPAPASSPPVAPAPAAQGTGSIENSVQTILEYGVRSRATDIHIEPRGAATQVRYRIDGVLGSTMSIPGNMHNEAMMYLKQLSGVNSSESRVAQSGQFEANFGTSPIIFRLTSVPTISGEKVTLQVVDEAVTLPTLEQLGLDAGSLGKISAALNQNRGVVLVTSPVAADCQPVLYNLLRAFDPNSNNIASVENPVSQKMPSVNQTQLDTAHGLNYPTAISTVLNQDPNVLLVGELADRVSAELVFDAALAGKTVLSGMHAKSSVLAIIRMNDMGVAPFLVAAGLKLVIATRRVRRLCVTCRQSYIPSGGELAKIETIVGDIDAADTGSAYQPSSNDNHAEQIHMKKVIPAPSMDELARKSILDRISQDPNLIYRGLEEGNAPEPQVGQTTAPGTQPTPAAHSDQPTTVGGATFYKAVGCPKCNGTGYLGQINLFEVLPVKEGLANAIAAAKPESDLDDQVRKSNLRPLARDGFDKASQGLTSLGELLRVL